MRSLSFIIPALLLAAYPAGAFGPKKPAKEKPVREIYVPFEDLDVLLQNQPRRVLLSREEYDALVKKAKKSPEEHLPVPAVLLSADYDAEIETERAVLTGKLALEVLEDGLHALPLDISGVGLAGAKLDGRDAAIGRDPGGRLSLLVEGVGRHVLALEMVAPLETTAARQTLHFRLPRPPAAGFHLTVPGDVEVKSGLEVVSRELDEDARITRFELLPKAGDVTLMLSLNSRLRRREQVLIARSVFVDEITQAYEKLHARISMVILHRAVDRFRFVVPEGFEVTEIDSPKLARWDVKADGGRRILNVYLREETTDTVKLDLSAIKTPSALQSWRLPRLEPLDVAGQVAVVGLLVEDRLQAEDVAPEGLIPINTEVLRRALPSTIFHPAPGTPPLRAVAAYYAPQGRFGLAAEFVKPPAVVAVTSSRLLIIADKGQEMLGGINILLDKEKRFGFDISVPKGWHIDSVTGPDEQPLAFERYGAEDEAGRIHVRVPEGIPVGKPFPVNFLAINTPAGWLDAWESKTVAFPIFAVAGVSREQGAVAVEIRDDMTVRPEQLEQLTPLDDDEKEEFGLSTEATSLAYRCEAPDYAATFRVERTRAQLTARTFSFLRVKPDALLAHYEIIFNVDEGRTRRLEIALPEDTPEALSIKGLDGLKIKEYTRKTVEGQQHWTVELAEPRNGTLRLAVDFQQRAAIEDTKDLPLPIVVARGVAYQSGMIAVEGDAELDVRIDPGGARRIDVGELVDADYMPGRRLLGAYSFVGDPPAVKLNVFRHPGYGLFSAIVERATLDTYVSANGDAQTLALFQLRTKALFLEVRLPGDSQLWSAELDGVGIKPQREGESLLVSLPAKSARASRTLKIVYAGGVRSLNLGGNVNMTAPKLLLRASEKTEAVEVPLNELVWKLYLPAGYRIAKSKGTVVTTERVEKPLPAAVQVLGMLYYLAGGHVEPGWFVAVQAARESARARPMKRPYAKKATETDYPDAGRSRGLKYWTDSSDFEGEGAGEDEMLFEPEPPLDLSESEPPAETPAPDEPASKLARPEKEVGPEKPLGLTHEVKTLEERKEELQKEKAGLEADIERERLARDQAKVSPVNVTVAAGASDSIVVADDMRFRLMLAGVRSLKIDLNQGRDGGPPVVFRSLGVNPKLNVTLTNDLRYGYLDWGLGLAVLLIGMAIGRRPVRIRAKFVITVALLATLAPLLSNSVTFAQTCNAVFFGVALLVPYYLLVALVRWLTWLLVRAWYKSRSRRARAAAAAGAFLLAICLAPAADAAPPAPPAPPAPSQRSTSGTPYVIQVVEPSPPVRVPKDALILPYDPDSKTGVKDANRLLVPYGRYVELWNLAHPDKKIEEPKAPVPYALAGGSYQTTLLGDDYLLVTGELRIDVFTDEYVTIPLRLGGGVLGVAELDGKPAKLSAVHAVPPAANAPNPPPQQAAQQAKQQAVQQAEQQAGAPAGPMVMLYVSGKGRHVLNLSVRMKLVRQGGWRVADGVLPAAPATGLDITVPKAETELRLGHVADRRSYETEAANEKINTALSSGGDVSIRWRPKVAEGEVDRTLTAKSTAVLDVREDGLRLVWRLVLEFRRSQREQFTVEVPADYLVEKVEGTNVRGWEARKEEGRQTVEVTLLNAAKNREQFTLHLLRGGPVGLGDLAEFSAPVVTVPDAVLHSGELTVRRSPQLDLRTVESKGLSRTNMTNEANLLAGGEDNEESPLGIRPYQAFKFATMPFTLLLGAEPILPEVTAKVQTILRVSDYKRTLESHAVLDVEKCRLYRVEIAIPDDLRVDNLSVDNLPAPGNFEWVVTERDGQRVLSVYLTAGRQGKVIVLLEGTLGKPGRIDGMPLPRLAILGAKQQEGEIAVQIDPSYDVRTEDLKNCKTVLLRQFQSWLNPDQREATRLTIAYRSADYAGTLKFSPRKPIVTCTTLTNLKVTPREIEETIVLEFNIQQAGIRRIVFQLPADMAGARIKATDLRQKTIEKGGADPPGPVTVRLDLQDAVMGEFLVFVENDRLLTAEKHSAPIPVVNTGRTNRRFVTIENASADEIVFESVKEMEPLSRQQREWKILKQMLEAPHDANNPPGAGKRKRESFYTDAFVIDTDAQSPELVFTTKLRELIKMAGAKIGLAETVLVLDSNGAYRAEITYHLNNKTEQFLEIELPTTGKLWAARVANQPVKPTEVPGANNPQMVRIPLVKTAEGDLDYEVRLYYGGKIKRLGVLRHADFPLVHTRNIDVARSLVELRLPKTHRWFDFGGSMGLVDDKGEYLAMQVDYLTEEAKQQLDTLRHGGKFSQARVLGNLRQIQETNRAYQTSADVRQNLMQSPKLQLAFDQNTSILQDMQQEITKQQAAPQEADAYDNWDRLNTRYQHQKTVRSRDIVKDLAPNWGKARGEPQPQPQSEAKFNYNFLDKNKLANPEVAEAKDRDKEDKKVAGKKTGGWQYKSRQPAAQPQARQPRAVAVAKGKVKEQLEYGRTVQLPIFNFPSRRKAVADLDRTAGTRYQQRLQVQQEAQQQGGQQGQQQWSAPRGRPAVVRAPVDFDADVPMKMLLCPTEPSEAYDVPDYGVEYTGGIARPFSMGPTGLASLEMRLPEMGDMCRVYFFTTPLGEVKVTGRAASVGVINRLVQLGILAAVVLLAVCLVLLVRRGRFNWLAGRVATTVMICIGLLCFVVALLPFAGLALAATGAVIKVRRHNAAKTAKA